MGRSVSEAAARATAKSNKKEKAVLTPERAIQELRNLRAAKLFVTNMELVDMLLAEYDRRVNELLTVNGEILLKLGEQVKKNNDLEDHLAERNERD